MKDYEQIISTLLVKIAELEKVVQQQASRIIEVAEQFARIRGFISTIRKRGLSIISSIQSIFSGTIPELSGIWDNKTVQQSKE